MSQFTLNLLQGAVSFNFSLNGAEKLKQDIAVLMQSLKEITLHAKTGGKPTPKKAMEYQYTGDVFFEVFCNPNIYPSPFSAKVLVTVRDERLRLTSEAELTRLVEDLEQYLSS
ncbi:MAG: hypothetical protein GW795_01545 [Cyanobacteria bacterium]|uniref:hypothetical protein n=1 Tax=Geminocystis sp. TaxID=2664100 RepID=UPI001D219909|nr:hypothetical protein [Cyanobacteria bacterium CG_2015-16_32_12]NCO79221.1 hypothetical protein [Cyanobacteria bacterium CG_2015-22_32_23]NCQ03318.1 hypothetical protein [Cyanobacteria bacterium CG_2015-09_32_10]NCQ40587.1 hypothetical protein [Cyanobacteria bacterium CG_2015-04_32_10]NCS85319.1 hypothetical protein [Cyanobacteria bacterium CG_2015-02_32_10]